MEFKLTVTCVAESTVTTIAPVDIPNPDTLLPTFIPVVLGMLEMIGEPKNVSPITTISVKAVVKMASVFPS